MKKSSYTLGVILSLLVGLSYGLATPFSKMLVSGGISPITIVLYRTVFPLFFWGAVLYFRGGLASFCINRSLLFYFFLMGIFAFVLKACGLVMSYKYLNVQFAIMLNYASPICTIFLNTYLNREHPRKLQIFAALLILFGLIYAFDYFEKEFHASLVGLFFAAVSIVGASFHAVYSSYVARHYKPDICQQIFYSHCLSAILLFAIKWLFGWEDLALITPRAFFNLNMVAITTSVISTFCFYWAMKLISSSTFHILSSTEILATLILVPLIVGIAPTPREVTGSIIIFVALYIATVAGKKN